MIKVLKGSEYDMNHMIGKKIAALRKEKHITQTELAEYLYLTPQTVSRWEAGKGTPEISLLPKIASFFGISIDELFGLTSMSRADELVTKYSILRDDRSFQEAMNCLNSQIETIDAALNNEVRNTAEFQKDRDKLEALKVHLLLQQGWESLERALKIVDSFVEKTKNNPQEPWYLPMRLQRLQLRSALGEERSTLTECEKNYSENPNALTLQLYFEMLLTLQDYEKVLFIQDTDTHARKILFPPSESNLALWEQLIRAAVGMGNLDFVEKYMEPVMEQSTEQDRYSILMSVIGLYKEKNLAEKLASAKKELISMLPLLSYDEYYAERIRKMIEQM